MTIETLIKQLVEDNIPVRIKDIEFVEPIRRGSELFIHMHDVIYPHNGRRLRNGKYVGDRNAYVKNGQLYIVKDIGSYSRVYTPADVVNGEVVWK